MENNREEIDAIWSEIQKMGRRIGVLEEESGDDVIQKVLDNVNVWVGNRPGENFINFRLHRVATHNNLTITSPVANPQVGLGARPDGASVSLITVPVVGAGIQDRVTELERMVAAPSLYVVEDDQKDAVWTNLGLTDVPSRLSPAKTDRV
jgi:hypothetical protein